MNWKGSFRNFIIIFCALIVTQSGEAKKETNSDYNFVEIDGQLRLSMSPFFRKKIRSINPTFRFFKESQFSYSLRDMYRESDNRLPHIVIEDFNKDGKKDMAVLGYYADRPNYFQVVIFETNRLKGYTFRNIHSFHGANYRINVTSEDPGQAGIATYLTFRKRISKKRRLASLKSKAKKAPKVRNILGVETWGSVYGDYFLIKKRSVKRY